jgi:hypothetical protein
VARAHAVATQLTHDTDTSKRIYVDSRYGRGLGKVSDSLMDNYALELCRVLLLLQIVQLKFEMVKKHQETNEAITWVKVEKPGRLPYILINQGSSMH